MRITVFGATGGTGRQVVRRAIAAGHEVTAVARAGADLDGLDGARVVTADVMDPAAIAPAIKDSDAVISALGPRGTGVTTVCSDGARSIAEAMAATGVRRLAVVGMAPVTTEGDGPVTRYLVKPMLRRMLRHAVADNLRMEEHLRSGDLDWTVVRPPMLTNGRHTGRYRTARGANVRGGIMVSRADVADALLAALDDANAVRTALGVAR